MKYITITIEGGVLRDVTGLPKGYSYELFDLDNCQAGQSCERKECPVCGESNIDNR